MTKQKLACVSDVTRGMRLNQMPGKNIDDTDNVKRVTVSQKYKSTATKQKNSCLSGIDKAIEYTCSS